MANVTRLGTDARGAGVLAVVGATALAGFLVPGADAALADAPSRPATPATPAAPAAARGAMPSGIPEAFVANGGQWDPRAQFALRVRGGTVFVSGASVAFTSVAPASDGEGSVVASSAVVFSGVRQDARFRGDLALQGAANFLIGSDPSGWQRGVPTWASLRCEDAWPGVDVTLDRDGRALRYGFEIAAGADPSAIALEFPAASRVSADALGRLVVETSTGVLVQSRPVAWQTVEGRRHPVEVAFARGDAGTVRLRTGTYDALRPLFIDPTVEFSSFIGGGDEDFLRGMDLADDGDIVVVGFTPSNDYPVTVGAFQTTKIALRDMFVSRIQSDGQSLAWSTYVGGDSGDIAEAVVNGAGSGLLGVCGRSSSSDFPTTGTSVFDSTNEGGEDGVLFLINAADGASLSYSSYYGSTGADLLSDLATVSDPDTGGFLWMAVGTAAGTVENSDGVVDFGDLDYTGTVTTNPGAGTVAFLVGVNHAASETTVGTHFPGSANVNGFGIASNRITGNSDDSLVWFTGSTSGALTYVSGGSGFQDTYGGGTSDAYVAILRLAAFPVASFFSANSFLGGSDLDAGTDVVLDAAGRAYVTGSTRSADFPVQNSLFTHRGGDDIFVARMSTPPSPSVEVANLDYCTLIGGSGSESGASIDIDAAGAVYVTGTTSTDETDFLPLPTTGAGSDTTLGGNQDAFVLKLHPLTNTIRYLTYLGGDNDAAAGEAGTAIACNAVGECVVAGFTSATAFPTSNAYDASYNSGSKDGFFTKLTTATVALTLGSCRMDEFKDKPAGPGPNKDQIIMAGSYTGALLFTPASNPFHVIVGPEDQLHALNIPAGSGGWTTNGAKHTWKGTVSGRLWNVQIDTLKKKFNVKVTKTNLDAGDGLVPGDVVVCVIEPGSAEGLNASQWVEPGVYSTRATMVLENP